LITKITGQLLRVDLAHLVLKVGAFEYEVLIPEFARRQLQHEVGHEISLHTIEYLEGNPAHGRLTPRLIGFMSPVEREFFDLFCEVDGVGAKKALRAMVRPVREVATAIEEQDAKTLASLPGIGPSTSERIIAKLRRRMPKFALIVAREQPQGAGAPGDDSQRDAAAEAFDALRSVGHSESEARRLLEAVLGGKKKFRDAAEIIQAVYQHTQHRDKEPKPGAGD
jgi:Holliday junction DNA helicase RuvA